MFTYSKHGGRIRRQSQHKHPESCLEVIQGPRILDHCDCVLLYNNVGCRVGNFKGQV